MHLVLHQCYNEWVKWRTEHSCARGIYNRTAGTSSFNWSIHVKVGDIDLFIRTMCYKHTCTKEKGCTTEKAVLSFFMILKDNWSVHFLQALVWEVTVQFVPVFHLLIPSLFSHNSAETVRDLGKRRGKRKIEKTLGTDTETGRRTDRDESRRQEGRQRKRDSLPFCLLSASGQTESVSQSNSESDSRSSFSLLGS